MTANDIASPDPNFTVSGSPIRRLILGGALLIAAIALGTAIMAGNFRERALNDSERELGNTVLLLAHHFDQQFEEFEVVQKDLVVYMRSTGIASTEAFKRQMSSQDMHEMLKSKSNGSSDVAGVNIFDSEGTLINSSAWPLPTVNIADRAFFKAFKSGTASTPLLIELLKSRLSKKGWTALISHVITGPNDEFLGLLTRGIATASFEKFCSESSLSGSSLGFNRANKWLYSTWTSTNSRVSTIRLGTPVGDELLKAVASRLRRRPGINAARGVVLG